MNSSKSVLPIIICLILTSIFQACYDKDERFDLSTQARSELFGTWFTYNADSINAIRKYKQVETYYLTFFEDCSFVYFTGRLNHFTLCRGTYLLKNDLISLDFQDENKTNLNLIPLKDRAYQLKSNSGSMLIHSNWIKTKCVTGIDFDTDSVFPRLEYCEPLYSADDLSFRVGFYSETDFEQPKQ